MTNRTDAIKLAIEALQSSQDYVDAAANAKFLAGWGEQMDKAAAAIKALADLQAREGEAVAPSAILARGRFHFFKGEDGEPDDWEWFEEGTNCEHGCIDAVIVRAEVEAFDKAENSFMRKAIELEAEVAKLRGLVTGRSAEHLAAHITYDKGYQEGRLAAETALKPVAEIGVSVFTWLGDRPPAGTTLYRIEQP